MDADVSRMEDEIIKQKFAKLNENAILNILTELQEEASEFRYLSECALECDDWNTFIDCWKIRIELYKLVYKIYKENPCVV